MDNEKLIAAAIATLEAAVARWDKDGEGPSVDYRLRVAQTEALISIAQSLAVLAEESARDTVVKHFGC